MPTADVKIPSVTKVIEQIIPEKIIHTLDLEDDSHKVFPKAGGKETQEEINLEGDSTIQDKVEPVSGQLEMDIIPTSDLIRNINVVYDEILLEDEADFEIIDTTVGHEQELPAENTVSDKPDMLSFDMPLQAQETSEFSEETKVVMEMEEEPVLFVLDEETAAIEVKEPIGY